MNHQDRDIQFVEHACSAPSPNIARCAADPQKPSTPCVPDVSTSIRRARDGTEAHDISRQLLAFETR